MNTSDFFVHKNLKGFLEGELDFYLKNEVLNVDDLEAWGPEHAEGWFEVMRAIKSVGRSIIAFLAQIEDFQKKLFEKKKYAPQSDAKWFSDDHDFLICYARDKDTWRP